MAIATSAVEVRNNQGAEDLNCDGDEMDVCRINGRTIQHAALLILPSRAMFDHRRCLTLDLRDSEGQS